VNTSETPDLLLEPERYELAASPLYHFETSRREFFKTLGCGLVVLFLIDTSFAQESGGQRRGRGFRGGQRPAEISAWLHIGEDNTITVFTGKAEMGQNIRTSLTQAVAEELQTPLSAIRLVMADTQLTPFDAGTFGSRTTPDMAVQLHKVAAAAREALLDLATEHFKADRATLAIKDGKISTSGSNEPIGFGELTKGRQLIKSVDDQSPVTAANKWKISGTSAPKVDGQDFVTGKHQYASDVRLPGMLYGKVLRPAAFEATLDSVDTKPADAMPGVKVVHDGNFIGVIAPNTQIATEALKKIDAKWTVKPQPSSPDLFDYLKKNATSGRGNASSKNNESPRKSSPETNRSLQQSYTIAYIAHAPLEPRAAVAEWKDDKLTVWTGTQRPFGVRGELAEAFSIPESQVRVIVPDTGSGYGGKHTGEVAVEAARLAKAAGKPVKLVWTREEEFTWAYFRPAGVIDISSEVGLDGIITAWEFHNYNSGGSGIRTPYNVPDPKTDFHPTKSPLRQGSYRGLAATANHFAREMHMDELAHTIKLDPLEFRLKNLKDSRMRGVLEAAAKSFGWGKSKAQDNRGFGLAVGTEKGSYVATCAEVSVDRKTGKVQVIRAVSAFECGAIVNPEHLKNQVEGAMVMGLGGALFEAIQFENGKITNPHFSSYRVPRFSDVPEIEVILLDRKDLPSAGAGETPIIGIAPAVGNAIFDATGIRLCSLPMSTNSLKS
jgi:CO/xanthine dehydrogenase Mo-binding subunit